MGGASPPKEEQVERRWRRRGRNTRSTTGTSRGKSEFPLKNCEIIKIIIQQKKVRRDRDRPRSEPQVVLLLRPALQRPQGGLQEERGVSNAASCKGMVRTLGRICRISRPCCRPSLSTWRRIKENTVWTTEELKTTCDTKPNPEQTKTPNRGSRVSSFTPLYEREQ